MSGDSIIFANTIAETIRCYAASNDEDSKEILEAINMSFKKENNNDDD